MSQQAENIGIRTNRFLLLLSFCIYKGIVCQRNDSIIYRSTTVTLVDQMPNLC